jgi:hypothetical protein
MPVPHACNTRRPSLPRVLARLVPLAAAAALVLGTPAHALEELKGEKKAISACERSLCSMLVKKDSAGPDLKCELTKTWAQKTIQAAESSTLSWSFGDARCTARVNVRRADILHAITAPKAKFWLPDQRIHCLVEEGGKVQDVHVLVSPKIEFRDGRAEKIWINLKEAEGPPNVVGLIRFAVGLSDKVGILHPGLVKSVNGFINKSCPKVLSQPEEVADASPPQSKPPRKKPAPEAPKPDDPAKAP